MREHKMIEGILKDQRGIYMAVKCSLGSSNQNKNIIEFTKQKGKFKGKRRRRRVRVMTNVSFVVKKAIRKRNALSS